MSTRGCVAVGSPDNWRGVYNHSDSYPTWLGAEVWKHLQEYGAAFLAEEILKWGDWREYLEGGVCQYCGKIVGQPHSISGVLFIQKDWQSQEEIEQHYLSMPGWAEHELEVREMAERIWSVILRQKETGYPDPDAQYHQHGNGVEEQMTHDDTDALFIEWVYVIDPDANQLHVLEARGVPMRPRFRKRLSGDYPFSHHWDEQLGCYVSVHSNCAYRHAYVVSIDLDGPEPDWEKLEEEEENEV